MDTKRLLVLFAVLIITLSGCQWGADKWEYKVLSVISEGHNREGSSAGKFSSVTPSVESINALGKEGWELSTSYLEMETAWVNFGNDRYVSGLQPNVRPQRVVMIFKRKL